MGVNRIIWKEGRVIKLEVKNGLFVLAQMIKEPYMIFYNHFSCSESIIDNKLTTGSILFFHAVTRQFIKKTNIETLDIEPLTGYTTPNLWLKEDAGSRRIKVWENTPNETEIITFGEKGAKLIVKNIFDNTNPSLSSADKAKLNQTYTEDANGEMNKYELTSIEIYPNLNERLFLCYKFGENIDPAKDVLFNKDLPLEYKTYIDIISGKVPLKSLGY